MSNIPSKSTAIASAVLQRGKKGKVIVNTNGVEKVKKERRKQVTVGGAEGVAAAACVHVKK